RNIKANKQQKINGSVFHQIRISRNNTVFHVEAVYLYFSGVRIADWLFILRIYPDACYFRM
ncbi:hypothetical protein D1V24_25335, partial [Salmonella enterica]|nr:hypothetical protein [Salmonella enterica]